MSPTLINNIYNKTKSFLTNNPGLTIKGLTIFFATTILYFQDLSIILFDAFYSEQNFHLLAILPLFAYLLYRKRNMIQTTTTQNPPNKFSRNTQLLTGILLSTIALLIYWNGSYTFIPIEYHMASLPIFVAGLTLILFNYQVLRQLIFPIAFLTFLMPPPVEILYSVGSALSVISAEASNTLANLLGISSSLVYEYGNPIINIIRPDQTTINFAVDIACSGIYSLIGFAIFATFIAYIVRSGKKSKIIILLLGVPLIILLNTLRITLIFIIGYHFGDQLALYLFHAIGGNILMFIGTLILLFIMEKYTKKPNPQTPCTFCANKEQNIKNSSCPNCGKLQKKPQIKLTKNDLIKIASIGIIIVFLLSIQVPIFALTEGPAQVIIQTPTGEQGNTQILPEIPGYTLQYMYRDTQFEETYDQTASIAYKYTPTNTTKTTIWVAVQISSIKSSLHRWETCLINWPLHEGVKPGVTQLDLRDIQTSTNPPITARYFAFQRNTTNQTQVVLYWYETSTFNIQGVSETKHVKMSLVTYLRTNQNVTQVEEEILPIAKTINSYWQPIQIWNIISLMLSQNGLTLLPIFAILLVTVIIYYLHFDWQEKKGLIKVYKKLSPHDKELIKTIHKAQKQTTTKQIVDQLQLTSKTKIFTKQTIKRLNQAQTLGLIKKVITNINDQPVIQWKTQTPTNDKLPNHIFNILRNRTNPPNI